MSSTLSSLEDTDVADDTGPYFRQKHFPGKGRGMAARRKIERGSLILEEPPLLRIAVGRVDLFQENLFFGAGDGSGGPAVYQEYNKLSAEDQMKYLQLAYDQRPQDWLNGHGRKRGNLSMDEWDCLSRLERNSWDASDDEAERLGSGEKVFVAFHRISFFNHSCKPNAVYKWHPERKCGMVHALREISTKEQIYLNYRPSLEDVLLSRKARREALQKSWAFKCTCTVCGLSANASKTDDEQRARALREWKVLIELPRPAEAVPMEQDHLDTLTWPDGSNDISSDEETEIQCFGPDMVALHREHRRKLAYFESVTAQFQALELNDSDM